MHRREAAHREADAMRLVDAETVERLGDVGDRPGLAVHREVVGHVGRGIAPGVERDAAVTAAEIPHLLLPGTAVAGKFVHEHDRRARPGFLVVEADAVASGEVGHGSSPMSSDPLPAGPYSFLCVIAT